jgi:hypothetical protein
LTQGIQEQEQEQLVSGTIRMIVLRRRHACDIDMVVVVVVLALW